MSEQARTILLSLSSRAPTAVSDLVHKVGVVCTPFSSVFSCSITKVLHREMRREAKASIFIAIMWSYFRTELQLHLLFMVQ